MEGMRRMEKNRSTVLFVLLAAIVVATAQTIESCEANNDVQKAVFSCFAVGKGLLYWGGAPGQIEPSGISKGVVTCGGSAMVQESGIPGWYGAVPGSVRCRGLVVVGWKFENVKYKLVVSLRPTEDATGLFIPEGDFFTVGVPEGPPHICYEGMLVRGRRVQRVSGLAWIGVSEAAGAEFVVFLFELELDGGLPGYVGIQWPEDWARVFRHKVTLLDE